MQRFLLQQNIAHYRRRLEHEDDALLRRTIMAMLAATERELAMADAALTGVSNGSSGFNRMPGRWDDVAVVNGFAREFLASPEPMLLLHAGPGLHIIDFNQAYAAATLIDRYRVPGERLFDTFPDNPDDPLADGVKRLYRSLATATETGRTHRMALQRYDVRNAEGRFQERWWQPENTPLYDLDGRLVAVLHRAADVTATVQAKGTAGTIEP